MKKILTLFCSLVAAVVLFAAPQIKLAPMSPATDTKLHPQVLHALTQDLSKRPAPATETIQRAPNRLATTAMVPPAPICLNGEGFLVGPEYDPATKEWYVALEAEGYTFRLCWFGEADTYCGTYVFEDISWEYTWGWFQSADMFYEIYFQDITMTVSEEQIDDCLKQITIYATLIDTNDNEYQLHAVHKAFSPKKTIYNVLNNAQVEMLGNQYLLRGSNKDMEIQLPVNSNIIEGAYTHKDFDMGGVKITYKGEEQQILDANLLVICDYLPTGGVGYDVEFSFYNQDTVLHVINAMATLPTPKDTIQIRCTNLSIDESFAAYGVILVTGSNEFYDVIAVYEGTEAAEGVYPNAAVTIADKMTWIEAPVISATLTLKENDGDWTANIEAYGSDYNWYSIDMSYVIPKPTDTVKISFPNAAMATFNKADYNMLQLLNYGQGYDASVTIYGIGLDEEFGMENVLLDYTEIYDSNYGRTVQIASILGELNQYGDTTVITASVIGFNAIQYDVELWYTAPRPVDTVEIEMPVEFVNNLDYGYYTLKSYTPDETLFISVAPIASVVEGTFINDGMFGKFGAADGRYDFYAGETFIYSENDWQNYPIEKGTLVVDLAPDGTLTAEAELIARNAVCYRIKMTSEYNTHLDFDEPEMDVDRTYTTEDQVFIENQIDPNGYIYLSITAADMSDMCAFFFFVEEADDDIVIPVGTYPINLTEEYGTVQANPGVQGNGVFPSFYAQMLEDGSLIVPLWLLVGGTVDVTKDEEGNAHLEVNAVNSYGVPVHIVYDGTPINTAVENTQSPMTRSQKLLRNGHLIIKNAGVEYNAQGAKVQ